MAQGIILGDLRPKLEQAVQYGRNYRHDRVFDVDEGLVAKAYRFHHEADYERYIVQFLLREGVQVPQMHGVISLTDLPYLVRELFGYDNHYLIMQKIVGEEIGRLRGVDRKQAEELFREEIAKVMQLGIFPKDADWGINAIYDGSNLHLIDFAKWRFEDDPLEYRRLRNWLSCVNLEFLMPGSE